jgi:hypothetical protein
MFLPCGFHIWIVKTFHPLNFESPSMFDPHMCMGFNLLALTNIGFDLKLLIKIRRTILLGKQYYTLNGSNHLFLNLPICVFSP